MSQNAQHRKGNRFDHRKGERFRHESIIMIKDKHITQPFFALMYNVSENGLYFESLFSLSTGTRITVKPEVPPRSFNQIACRAKVIWCRELTNICAFSYGVGVKYC